MQGWKQFITEYFSFGKRDRIGLFVLISLIVLIYALPYLSARKNEAVFMESPELIKGMDTLVAKQEPGQSEHEEDQDASAYRYQPGQIKGFTNGELFRFDPNTLPVEGWQKLGLSDKTSRTIDNYRRKGGKFYKPEDIKKIWGMPEGFYERVKDSIVIASLADKSPPNGERTTFGKSEKKAFVVDINEADTSALIALPGIGSKLAARIINFRDKLGGFYSVEQVRETYGLPDSTFQKIKGSLQLSGTVNKFNINTATRDELKLHPYIKWNIANAIVEYRNQHGNFKSLEELKKIALIDEATFEKIVHYFAF